MGEVGGPQGTVPLALLPPALRAPEAAERIWRASEGGQGPWQALPTDEGEAFVLPTCAATGWVPFVQGGGVLVRWTDVWQTGTFWLPYRKLTAALSKVDDWRPVGEVTLGDDYWLVHPTAHCLSRVDSRIELRTAPGRYAVEHLATRAYHRLGELELVRLRPVEIPQPSFEVVRSTASDRARKKLGTRASKARFVDSGGGPLVALDRKAKRAWLGVLDAQGQPREGDPDTHYARACGVEGHVGLVPFGDHTALVLVEHATTTWLPLADGGAFVRVRFADQPADWLALTESLLADTGSFTWLEEPFEKGAGMLSLFDAADAGEDPSDLLGMRLKPGAYRVGSAEREEERAGVVVVRLAVT